MKKILVLSLGCLLSFSIKAQSDLVVGSTYKLNIQRQNTHGDAFILHNASYSSSDDILSWSSTHPSFGSRGIRFAYGAGKGIYFYANETATTANTTFNPVPRFFIGNNGKVGIGTTSPASVLDVNGGLKAGSFTGNPSIDDHAVIKSSGSVAYEGGLVFTNSTLTTGYGVKVSASYCNSAMPSFRIGAVSLASPNTFSRDYLFMGEGKVGVGLATPSTAFEVNGTISMVRGNKLQFNETIGGAPRASIGSSDANELLFHVGASTGTDAMIIDPNGNVGIGTTEPEAKLHIKGGHIIFDVPNSNPTIYTSSATDNINPRYLSIINSITNTSAAGVKAGGVLVSDLFSYANPDRNTLIVKGRIGIGLASPHHTLDVNGIAHAKEVLVDLNGWPDYVFEPEFNLMPLSEVETFIKENKHLPEIPSAEEVKENGVALGEMNALLLKKIEELTLYVIELKKENEEIKKKIDR